MSDIGEGSQVWHLNNTIRSLEREVATVTKERDELRKERDKLLRVKARLDELSSGYWEKYNNEKEVGL